MSHISNAHTNTCKIYLQCWSHWKDTKQLEKQTNKKEPLFCGKSKASGSKNPETGRKSKWSLSGLPSRCIISKTRAFCSEGYFFLVQTAFFMMVLNYCSPSEPQSCASPRFKYKTSFACISPCRCNGFPRHHSLDSTHV